MWESFKNTGNSLGFSSGDFALSLQWAWVQPLVGELNYKPSGQTRQTKSWILEGMRVVKMGYLLIKNCNLFLFILFALNFEYPPCSLPGLLKQWGEHASWDFHLKQERLRKETVTGKREDKSQQELGEGSGVGSGMTDMDKQAQLYKCRWNPGFTPPPCLFPAASLWTSWVPF